MFRAMMLVMVVAVMGAGCQEKGRVVGTAAAVAPAAEVSAFVGYWYSGEAYGKPIASGMAFHLDITADGKAVLIASPASNTIMAPQVDAEGNRVTVPDVIQGWRWTQAGAGMELREEGAGRVFQCRVDKENTLVITGPDVYVRMQRQM